MIKLSIRDNSILDLEEEIDAFSQMLRNKYHGLILDYHFDDRHGVLVISRIIVPKDKRNQGIGKDVMTNLMNFAKSKGLKTILTPTPEYGSSKERLNKFYKDFGFKKNKDMAISETMIASIKISARDMVAMPSKSGKEKLMSKIQKAFQLNGNGKNIKQIKCMTHTRGGELQDLMRFDLLVNPDGTFNISAVDNGPQKQDNATVQGIVDFIVDNMIPVNRKTMQSLQNFTTKINMWDEGELEIEMWGGFGSW